MDGEDSRGRAPKGHQGECETASHCIDSQGDHIANTQFFSYTLALNDGAQGQTLFIPLWQIYETVVCDLEAHPDW